MKPGIQFRLFFAITLVITLVVLAMAVAVNWSFRTGFSNYLQQVELERLEPVAKTLAFAYGEHEDWEFLRHNHRMWGQLVLQGRGENPVGRGRPPRRHDDRGYSRHPPPPPHGQRRDGPPPRPDWRGERHPPPPAYRDGAQSRESADNGRRQPPPRSPDRQRPPPRGPEPSLTDFTGRLRLLDVDGDVIFGRPEADAEESRYAVTWQGDTIGYLALQVPPLETDQLAGDFQDQQMQSFVLIAVLALLLSALTALLLSRRLLQPIRRITSGAKRLGAGRYDARIPVDRSDELGRLAEDFNHLAATLESNEQARRQWIADISHELRTPLAILRGEIEALLDGVRQCSPRHIESLHNEVLGLGKLVDDLYELALSDLGAMDYKRESLDLAEIIEDSEDFFLQRFRESDLKLINRVKPPLPFTGDRRRLQQLFTNLLENSRRYTDAGGRLEISHQALPGTYRLILQDTAPGAPEAALPHLFERLYRVDKSRSRALGGSGLGLAICHNIVQAHGGDIRAEPSGLGGLSIVIELPSGSTA